MKLHIILRSNIMEISGKTFSDARIDYLICSFSMNVCRYWDVVWNALDGSRAGVFEVCVLVSCLYGFVAFIPVLNSFCTAM